MININIYFSYASTAIWFQSRTSFPRHFGGRTRARANLIFWGNVSRTSHALEFPISTGCTTSPDSAPCVYLVHADRRWGGGTTPSARWNDWNTLGKRQADWGPVVLACFDFLSLTHELVGLIRQMDSNDMRKYSRWRVGWVTSSSRNRRKTNRDQQRVVVEYNQFPLNLL